MWPRRVTNSMSARWAGVRAGWTLTTQVARATRAPHPDVTARRRPAGTPVAAWSGPAKRTGVRVMVSNVLPPSFQLLAKYGQADLSLIRRSRASRRLSRRRTVRAAAAVYGPGSSSPAGLGQSVSPLVARRGGSGAG